MAKDSVLLLGVLVFVLAVLGFFSCGSKVIPASRIIIIDQYWTKFNQGVATPTLAAYLMICH